MHDLGQSTAKLLSSLVALSLILFALISIVMGPRRAGKLAGVLGKQLLRGLRILIRRSIKPTIRLMSALIIHLAKWAWWLFLQLRVRKSIR